MMTNNLPAIAGTKPCYRAKYAVEYFERKRQPSYALWAIAVKDLQTGRYPKIPTGYGRAATLEQAHLDLSDWCEARGLTIEMLRKDIFPWRLVKDLLAGKSGAEWYARQVKRHRAPNTVLDIPRTEDALVYAIHGQPMTDSVKVAEMFDKQHKNVLRAYDHLPKDDFNRLNFEPADFIDKNGETRRMVRMTWKGFSMLAMGFTGARAYLWKQQFLDAFEAMGQEIDRRRAGFVDPPRGAILNDKRLSGAWLTDAVLEWRTDQGKETSGLHYMAEHKLCNWVVTGAMSAIDEATLNNDDLMLLQIVRARNAALIVAGIEYAERKRRLIAYAMRHRTKRLAAA